MGCVWSVPVGTTFRSTFFAFGGKRAVDYLIIFAETELPSRVEVHSAAFNSVCITFIRIHFGLFVPSGH